MLHANPITNDRPHFYRPYPDLGHIKRWSLVAKISLYNFDLQLRKHYDLTILKCK